MKIIQKIKKLKIIRQRIKAPVGFVPTMGALHEGHISLIKKAKKENKTVIVSIFVNPTQFNDKKDLKNYPKKIVHDIKILSDVKTDIVFIPNYQEIYPDKYKYRVIETDFSKKLCGAFREGHFDGVLTVVMKLFNIVKPDKAYFGEKDYQQYILIKEMVKAFFLDIKIILCPTIREVDGLAKSSRNLLLSEKQRRIAPLIYQTINKSITDNKIKQILTKSGFDVEYVESISGRRFVAAKLGNIRLIDNVIIKRRKK